MNMGVTVRKYFLLFVCSTYISGLCHTHTIPLLGAAKLGSKKLVRHLLCAGANPNAVDEYGNTALHYAAHIGSKSIVDLLLAHNAHVNITNNKHKTPAHVAAQKGNDYIIRRLLVYGADPNIQDNQGNTPLHIAAMHAHKVNTGKIVLALTSYNAQTSLTNSQHKTPLMLVQELKPTYECFSKYTQSTRIQRIISMLTTPIHMQPSLTVLDKQYIRCAKTTNVTKLTHLLCCPTINKNIQYGKHKRTALMYAIKSHHLNTAAYLVQNARLDTSLKDAYGLTALDYARRSGDQRFVALFS